jgi:tRNA(fMet)-specific endonuclease VapC
MTRFLLDTGIAGLYLSRKRGVFERAQVETANGNRVGIAGPVLAELVFRAEGSPKRQRNLQLLQSALNVWSLWLPDAKASFEYGRIAFMLKTIGRPIGQNDIMIAAIAVTLGNCVVVTMDTDMSAIPGLIVDNWATPLAGSQP